MLTFPSITKSIGHAFVLKKPKLNEVQIKLTKLFNVKMKTDKTIHL